MTKEEKLLVIMDHLQIQDGGKHTGKEARVKKLSKIFGKGWGKANIYKFQKVLEYDLDHQNNFELCYQILDDSLPEKTITIVHKFVMTIDEITHIDEYNSYLYLLGLHYVETNQPVDGLRKIGYSDCIKKRLNRLNSDLNKKRTIEYGTISPYEYKPVKVWKGRKNLVEDLERDLHNLLKSYVRIGEWYNTNENFVDLLNEILISNGLEEVDVEIAKKGSEIKRPYKYKENA